jgi:hypothetical protein
MMEKPNGYAGVNAVISPPFFLKVCETGEQDLVAVLLAD